MFRPTQFGLLSANSLLISINKGKLHGMLFSEKHVLVHTSNALNWIIITKCNMLSDLGNKKMYSKFELSLEILKIFTNVC